MRRFARRPSPAMAVAFVALLAALSGTAVALPGKNTVDSGDLKKNAVKAPDIARNAVTGPKIRNGAVTRSKIRNGAVNGQKVQDDSLTGTDINESTLGQVPSAASANSANNANNANNATTANNANNLGGAPPSAYATRLWAVVDETGALVRGAGAVSAGVVGSGREVVFNRDVSGCAWSATIVELAPVNPPSGEITLAPRMDNANAVFVQPKNSDGGNNAAKDWVLTVDC